MKVMKRVSVLLLVAALLLPSVALAETVTAKELFATAMSNFEALESYESVNTMKMDIELLGERVDFKSTTQAKYIQEPLAVQVKSEIRGLNRNLSRTDIYMQQEEEEVAIYLKTGDTVMRMAEAVEDVDLAEFMKDATETPDMKQYKNIRYEGIEKLKGKRMHVLSAEIRASELEEGIMSQLQGSDELRLMKQMLRDMGDQPVKLYISTDTNQLMRMEIDITDMLQSMYDSIEIDFITVREYTIIQDIKNHNKVKPFKVPSSIVKKAVTY